MKIKFTWRDTRLFKQPGLFLCINGRWWHLFNPNPLLKFFNM